VLKQAAWSWSGVPSGPLGWISTRTAFPLLSGTVYQNTADALHLQADDELLDVACGSGAFLAQHATRARRVAGIDLSDIQIDLAHRHLADRIAAGTADIVKGDASNLPWPDGSFTAAMCISAFEVFPDPEQVLSEIHRVLRYGSGPRTTCSAWSNTLASPTSPWTTAVPGATTHYPGSSSRSGTSSAKTPETSDSSAPSRRSAHDQPATDQTTSPRTACHGSTRSASHSTADRTTATNVIPAPCGRTVPATLGHAASRAYICRVERLRRPLQPPLGRVPQVVSAGWGRQDVCMIVTT
jgi:hypothetical protein